MKTLLTITLVFLCYVASAQTPVITANGQPISKTTIIKTDSTLNSDKLYSAGLQWFVKIYDNPKKVIQLEDQDGHIIIGKGSKSIIDTFKYSGLTPTIYQEMWVQYYVKLSFKNGKVKCDIYEFSSEGYNEIKDGEISVTDMPKSMWLNNKKMADHYKRAYTSLQRTAKNECDNITYSVTKYFTSDYKQDNW